MLNILKTKKEVIFLFLIAVLFLAIRIPGVHIPYHQDEYKWPMYSDPAIYAPGSVPHPPLTEFIYRIVAPNFGYDNFRFVPLIFSFINLFLLYYLTKSIFNEKVARWVTFLFSISFYSILSSLMIDVDGTVMPFFFLMSTIGYFKFKISDYKDLKWGGLLIGSLLCGFLVKVVFVLPIAAIAMDFAIDRKVFNDRKKILKYIFWSAVAGIALILILFGIKYVFPFFNLSKAFKYWEHFAVLSGRGWFQTGIQFVKAIFYTSPLLILPLVFINKEIWLKTRVFFFYIIFGLIFYLFAFDFSLGALDRYFEFLVVPLSIISGAIYSNYSVYFRNKKNLTLLFLLIALFIFLLQFNTQFVPSQYPKTEWVNRALSFKWNFLFPFTGGSGPTGFYISFLFMGVMWLISTLTVFSRRFFVGILILGLVYNIVFIEEYLFGKINGSPYHLFQNAKTFIIKDPNIENVIVYNDIGGYEIRETGKYFRRMYATPQFEEEYKNILGDFYGHILYINIPRVQSGSFYEKYMDSCNQIYSEKDRQINVYVFDCKKHI